MPNNIANKLVASAETQAEIENFLSAIAGVERDETLDIDFERIIPMPECLSNTMCDGEDKNALYYYLMTTGNEGMVDKLFDYPQFYSMDEYKDKTEKELSDYKVLGEKLFNIALQMEPLIGTIGEYVIGAQNGTRTKRTLIVVAMVVWYSTFRLQITVLFLL